MDIASAKTSRLQSTQPTSYTKQTSVDPTKVNIPVIGFDDIAKGREQLKKTRSTPFPTGIRTSSEDEASSIVCEISLKKLPPTPISTSNSTGSQDILRTATVAPWTNGGDSSSDRTSGSSTGSQDSDSVATPKLRPKLPQAVPPQPKPKTDSLTLHSWFCGDLDREMSKNKVLAGGKDGSFVVRNSNRGGSDKPYTLCLLYKREIFNIHIRKRPDKKFSLGNEKPHENIFDTVPEIIKFHFNNPLELFKDDKLIGRVTLLRDTTN